MFRRVMLGLAAALSLAMGGQAVAADRTVAVTVGGKAIRLPVPADLCEPTGAFIDLSDKVAKLDTANETLLTLYHCADMAAGKVGRYVIYKSPLAGRDQPMTLEILLSAYRDSPGEFDKVVDAFDADQLAKDTSKAFDEKIEIEVGMKMAGADANGLYTVASSRMQGADKTVFVSLSTGITVVKGRIIGANVYGSGGSKADMAQRVTEAKAATRALLDANKP